MTPEEFPDAIRDDNRTALSRLGSSKSLYADTRGEMEREAVLAAQADAAHAEVEVFSAWAGDETDEPAGEAFRAAAAAASDRYEIVADELDGHDPEEVPAYVEYLRGLEDTVERLGGLVGHALIADEKASQATGFFTGQADPGTARVFRSMGEIFDEELDQAIDRLGDLCDAEDDWDHALAAAGGTVQAAYDEYVEHLEDMGVNPKPVC